jgi:serine/threonine-protein kinase HipA
VDEHPLSLLHFVGEEVAGAAQFIRPDRVDQALAPGGLRPLTESEVADFLRASLAEQPEVDDVTRTGRFSLAGAQAKIALHLDQSGWNLPSGRVPTTHIIKPAIPAMADQEAAEHMAMGSAKAIGLLVANSATGRFEDIPVIIVERYDRSLSPSGWIRIHQEDLGQALGVSPVRKYQNLGGPSPLQITDRIREVTGQSAEEDVRRFAQAMIYNWLIVGTDAHAKNYSLILAGNQARLAPLYDLNSVLPAGGSPSNALSMRIGSAYRADRVTRHDWEDLAVEIGLDSEWLFAEIVRQAELLPSALGAEGRGLAELGVGGRMPIRFVDAVANWLPTALQNIGV